MRRILLVSLAGLSLVMSAPAVISLPASPAATGLMLACDKSRLNDGKPFEWIDVFIRKSGVIVWNGAPVTREQYEAYITDAGLKKGTIYTFIKGENSSPALVEKVRALKTAATMHGLAVPDCIL
ncbi:MAG TPA: hypothetical protein VHZ32_15910 [Rhizomicrobium sp.]|jgi:hypothetical protein|nr:hypothetical protein [Rhizomicrobium sp.]